MWCILRCVPRHWRIAAISKTFGKLWSEQRRAQGRGPEGFSRQPTHIFVFSIYANCLEMLNLFAGIPYSLDLPVGEAMRRGSPAGWWNRACCFSCSIVLLRFGSDSSLTKIIIVRCRTDVHWSLSDACLGCHRDPNSNLEARLCCLNMFHFFRWPLHWCNMY